MCTAQTFQQISEWMAGSCIQGRVVSESCAFHTIEMHWKQQFFQSKIKANVFMSLICTGADSLHIQALQSWRFSVLYSPDKQGFVLLHQTRLQTPLKPVWGTQDKGCRERCLAGDRCVAFIRGKCLFNHSCWNLAATLRARNPARTIRATLLLMVVHRGNNHKKPGSLSEWLLTFISYSNHSPSTGQFTLNMQNCEDKMWDLPFSMHIKDTCHQDVTQELWEQEVQFLRDRLTHHQNHEIRPRKISLWWEKCYTLVHFAYKKNPRTDACKLPVPQRQIGNSGLEWKWH